MVAEEGGLSLIRLKPTPDGYGAKVPIVGFHASHEQISPSGLLAAVKSAEAAGFQAAMCSDHLAPWSEQQGHSGHAWSCLEVPSQFDDTTEDAQLEDVTRAVLVSAHPAQHVKWLRDLVHLGVDAIYLHHVGKEQERFIDVFAEHVLPEVIG